MMSVPSSITSFHRLERRIGSLIFDPITFRLDKLPQLGLQGILDKAGESVDAD